MYNLKRYYLIAYGTAFLLGGVIANDINQYRINAFKYNFRILKIKALFIRERYLLSLLSEPLTVNIRPRLFHNIDYDLDSLESYLNGCIDDEDSPCSPILKQESQNTLDSLAKIRDRPNATFFDD